MMHPIEPSGMRPGETRIGLTRERRLCGRLSKKLKPCDRYTQPYEPWCWDHCSKDEKEFAINLRRVYWEGYREGFSDHSKQANNTEWRLLNEIEDLRRQVEKKP